MEGESMFGTVSTVVLLVIAMVAFANYRAGTLGSWLRAKFFNAAAPPPPDRTAGGGGGGTRLLAFHGGSDAGSFADPLGSFPTTITSPFGAPRSGYAHQGIDLGAPTGTPVYASAGGTVTNAGQMGSYGLMVQIDHGGGFTTRYGHLSVIDVAMGDTVTAGQEIGRVGATGDATGAHLHFEIRDQGTPVDPLRWLTNLLAGSGTLA